MDSSNRAGGTSLLSHKLTLLSQLGLSLLDGGDNHVTGSSSWQSVQSRTNTVNGNDEQVLGARVVGAVHHGTHWQCQGHAEFSTNGGLGHLGSL